MFGTFRYNRSTKDHEHIEISRADGIEARGFTRVACKSCRDRKLKCSGEKAGCKKCRAMSQKCIYNLSQSSSTAASIRLEGGGRTIRHPSLVPPELPTGRAPSSAKPAGSKSPGGLASSVAAPPTSGPSPTLAGICPSLPATSLPSNCFYDDSGDWDIYAADPSLFTSNDGPGAFHGSSTDLQPNGDANSRHTFQSNRRVANNSDWSLPSTHPTIPFDLPEDTAMLQKNNQDYNAGLSPLLMHEAQLHRPRERVEDHSWELDFELGSTDSTNQRVPSETHSGQSGLGTHADADMALRSTAIMMPSPETASGSNSSYAENSKGSSEFIRPTSSQGSCRCLQIMAQALQGVDAQGAGTDPENSKVGIDVLVILLGRGMETLEEVLACEHCNACVENGIIIATLAQQLTFVAESAAKSLMVHGRQLDRELSTPHSSHSEAARSEVLGGDVSFGRCKIGAPRMRLSLVRHAVLLHVAELRTLLGRTKRSMSRSRGAWKLLSEIEAKIGKINDFFRQPPIDRI